MGAQRSSFGKLQRDRAKKANAQAKRERRQAKSAETASADVETEVAALPAEGDIPADQLLALIEQLHRQFENKEIDYEEFEERKVELFARITV